MRVTQRNKPFSRKNGLILQPTKQVGTGMYAGKITVDHGKPKFVTTYAIDREPVEAGIANSYTRPFHVVKRTSREIAHPVTGEIRTTVATERVLTLWNRDDCKRECNRRNAREHDIIRPLGVYVEYVVE